MSNFRTTPKTARQWTSYLVASACAAVALDVAAPPLGLAAANAVPAGRAVVHIATGTDHSVIAADAVATGDVETVEMSIAAYDRGPASAPSR